MKVTLRKNKRYYDLTKLSAEVPNNNIMEQEEMEEMISYISQKIGVNDE